MSKREDIDSCWMDMQDLFHVSEELFSQLQKPFAADIVDDLQSKQSVYLQKTIANLDRLKDNWGLSLFSEEDEMVPLQHLFHKVERLQKRFTQNLQVQTQLVNNELKEIKKAKRKLRSLRDAYAGKGEEPKRKRLDTRL
jgi:hypothetical protein